MLAGADRIEVAMASIKKPSVIRIFAVQLGVLLPLCLLTLLLVSKTAAISALWGGLLCVLPHAYFASYAFRYVGARSSRLIARSFYRGEAGKFLLAIVGFALVFTLVKPLDLVALFCAYVVMLVVQWIVTAKLVARRSAS